MKVAEAITRAIDFFYIKPVRKVVPQDMFRYAVCGGANLVLSWVVYWFLYHYVVPPRFFDFGLFVMSPHTLAYLINSIITTLTGFWLNRNVTFTQSTVSGGSQFVRYILQVGVSMLIGYFGLKLFTEVLHIYPTIANVLSSLITILFSFLTAKFFTFRTARRQD